MHAVGRMVKWLNTAVCKTAIRGFESHSGLQHGLRACFFPESLKKMMFDKPVVLDIPLPGGREYIQGNEQGRRWI